MSENRAALITGANKAIGLQIAKDLAGQGLTVLIGFRKYESRGAAAKGIGKKPTPSNSM
jgi:NAD(P)-dependent dehydrogenase (short-subunit alcohol dehydrogenase family)